MPELGKKMNSRLDHCFKVSLLASVCLLTGCANMPRLVGVDADTWKAMSSGQRHERIALYNQYRLVNQTDQFVDEAGPDDGVVELTLVQGQARMWPYDHPYAFDEASLRLVQGHCRSVLLHAIDGRHQTRFEACYKQDAVFLDPKRNEKQYFQGTVRLEPSRLWNFDWIYRNMQTEGYTALQGADLVINWVAEPEVEAGVLQAPLEPLEPKPSSKPANAPKESQHA